MLFTLSRQHWAQLALALSITGSSAGLATQSAQAQAQPQGIPIQPVAGSFLSSSSSPQANQEISASLGSPDLLPVPNVPIPRSDLSAAPTPVQQYAPPFVDRSATYASEEDLIRRMTNGSGVSSLPTAATAATVPVVPSPQYGVSTIAPPMPTAVSTPSAYLSTVPHIGASAQGRSMPPATTLSPVAIPSAAPAISPSLACSYGYYGCYTSPNAAPASYPAYVQTGADSPPPPPLGNPLPAIPTVPVPPQPQVVPVAPAPTPGFQQSPAQPATIPSLLPTTNAQELKPSRKTLLRSTALSEPSFQLQGVLFFQDSEVSARGRLSIAYPLSPRFLLGATFDITEGSALVDSREEGFNVNELYIAASLPEIPSLRFVVGQLDLTSYFDRNSFAKDGATHFFNPLFQTNPALAATGLSSRPGLLLNWGLTDTIEAKAVVFSSSRELSDFSLDAFAGELGIRYGNAIIRGTYVSGRNASSLDGFREIFQVDRGNGVTGPLSTDREESYGINAEVFVPQLNMGIFGRYGRYTNQAIGLSGDTYNIGISFLNLFSADDRLGIAYGRALSNDLLRRQAGDAVPDVVEVFYDFRFLPNLRLGFSIQQRNEFQETIAGVRVKTEFDVTPRGKLTQ